MPPIDQPSKVAMKLMPYQSEGVGWMIRSENSHVRGGILADEMEMGKTLQAISLIMSTRAERKAILKQYKEVIGNYSSNTDDRSKEEAVSGAESIKKSGRSSSIKKKKEKSAEIIEEQKSSVTTPPRRKGGRGKKCVQENEEKIQEWR